MDLVVDASALIAVIAGEPEKARLVEATRGRELAAPQSLHWEMGNAFSAMLKSRRISLDAAIRALAIYRSIPIVALDVDLEDALRIAAAWNLYAYDAYLIHCALRHRLPLISLDRKLLAAARKAGVSIIEVV